MKQIPQIFSRYLTQLWYILMIPFFFFGFTMIYRPFGMQVPLDMGKDLFAFNVTMLMCIILVILALTRTLFWLLYKHLSRNWWQFIAWCALELIIIAYFSALYLFLMFHRTVPYFELVGICVGYAFLILMYPYIIITTICVATSGLREKEAASTKELIRFQDAGRQTRLILSKDAVLFIKAEENYVKIHYLENGRVKDYQLRSTMSGIEPMMRRYGLFRCQRSYFVNPAHITALRKDPANVMTAELDAGGFIIPVSRALYKELTKLL